jgi:hypothetical protein
MAHGILNQNKLKITYQRDLENLFRLWICGVPVLASAKN